MDLFVSSYLTTTRPTSCLRINILLCVLKMPFYAVAKGRVPGVYKTWEECQNQTRGFSGPKFRKFNTEAEAREFVKTNGSSNSDNSSYSLLIPSTSTTVENQHPPELKALGKYSSQTLLKQDKLSMIAEKLDEFMEQTNKKLNELSKRLNRLESCFNDQSVDLKRKPNEDSEVEEIYEPKKKKTLLEDYTGDEIETRRSSRNKTKSNGAADNVDWGGSNSFHGGFMVDPEGFTVVYTDGACSNNGRRGAKAGVGVWFNHNHPFNVAAPVDGTATNNNAEIQAATRAIDQAILAGIRRLNIHTDSQFMINCMTDWIKKWKMNDWMTSAGGPVKNKEQLVILDRAIQRMDAVKWTHVRGHMGNEGNECADALAVRGAAMYKSE